MDRIEFHRSFKAPGPVVLPVIHVLDTSRTLTNVDVLISAGAAGCFLINHDFGLPEFLPILIAVRSARPRLWMGCNFLGVTGKDAFPVLGDLQTQGCFVDAYWADDACIDETGHNPSKADEIAVARDASGWNGLYFGGTAFKKQRPVAAKNFEAAARHASDRMDVVTTSGTATGKEADLGKVRDFRRGIGNGTLALASGVTPENASVYSDVDAFLVATGINHPGNFYDIDPARLRELMTLTRNLGCKQ